MSSNRQRKPASGRSDAASRGHPAGRRRSSRSPRARWPRPGTALAIFAALMIAAVTIILLRPQHHQIPPSPSAPLPILLAGPPGARFAGEIVAQANGLFGGAATVGFASPGPDFIPRVLSQKAIGAIAAPAFLLAAWQGAPVTAFAASLLDTPAVIFTLQSSNLRRPQDLVGKRLGYKAGNDDVVVVDAMFAQLGLPRSQITMVSVDDEFEALRTGTVDAVVSEVGREPLPSEAGVLALNRISPADYAIHVPGIVYFASSDLVRERPIAVSSVITGLIKGWRQAYADEASSVAAIMKVDPRLDRRRVAYELQQQRSLVLPIGGRIAEFDESRWRTLRDILIFSRRSDETVPLADLVNYRYLLDIYRRDPALKADHED